MLANSTSPIVSDLSHRLRGRVAQDVLLGPMTWFRVGGAAQIVVKPLDGEDVSAVMAYATSQGIEVTVLGVGSNVIVRDGGIRGIVVRLVGKGFSEVTLDATDSTQLTVGGGALDRTVSTWACENGISGLEFLVGIPGTMGGAVRMNAGAYGSEMKDVLRQVEVIDEKGHIMWMCCDQLGLSYRSSTLPKDWIVTRMVCQGTPSPPEVVQSTMDTFLRQREQSQPVRARTGGSTFKNPDENLKAWQWIDAAGCRGMCVGGAQVSELHCNFLINTGTATAQDLEDLGEKVRERVFAHSGILLEWEIKRIGERSPQMPSLAISFEPLSADMGASCRVV